MLDKKLTPDEYRLELAKYDKVIGVIHNPVILSNMKSLLGNLMEKVLGLDTFPLKGKQQIARDINMMPPVCLGLHLDDVTEFLAGDFNQSLKNHRKEHGDNMLQLKAMSRLLLLLSTYNWFCSIEEDKLLDVIPSIKDFKRSRSKLISLVKDLLIGVMVPPVHSKEICFDGKDLKVVVKEEEMIAAKKFLKDFIDQQNPIYIGALSGYYKYLLSDVDNQIRLDQNLMLDNKLGLMINASSAINTLVEGDESYLQELFKLRYQIVTIYLAEQWQVEKYNKSQEILENWKKRLEDMGVSPEVAQDAVDFFSGRIDFHFSEDDSGVWIEEHRGQNMLVKNQKM